MSNSTRSVKIVRWIVRILGALPLLTFIIFFSAEVIEKGAYPKIDSPHLILSIFFIMAMIGYYIVWLKEELGILMASGGIILGVAINAIWVHQGNAPRMLYYLLPAALFLYCWLSDKIKSA